MQQHPDLLRLRRLAMVTLKESAAQGQSIMYLLSSHDDLADHRLLLTVSPDGVAAVESVIEHKLSARQLN
jgi:hypothetical protein